MEVFLRESVDILRPFPVGRVSNKSVLERAGQAPLTVMLQNQRAHYMTELLLRPIEDPFRRMIFEADGSIRQTEGKMLRGRPRTRWYELATADGKL